ncbi:S46 family peptidase [Colwellia sp. E2M01]|uniref:S46 family peptidase n=1 Tax=Colwellia sp. E2M01 TaxID=2841561 RepID=UPI001C07F197|nr:S46 family peptidase [Colwellia sp. E2M01]MBU2871792.1 S46 family peptidase [Colwellia sp. E2M01]
MKNVKQLLTLAVLALNSMLVSADEGMWQPNQLPAITEELTKAGLTLNPKDLTDLTGFPMGAIVSLGGCTASFVSDQGLVATNHHCVYGSVQYNSTPENNLLDNGFLAKNFAEELPATPGTRIYVTEEITEVTQLIKNNISETMSGTARYKVIDDNSKKLVAECESDERYRCRVVNFHGGLEYYLFKQLTIRDVRLVHAPASSIGKFGGDIDNWMWPRHTGDYGFYRAYVNKDGQPADFSEDNVPYQPKHHLKLNKSGVDNDDYIMVIGYPGRTNRYRTAYEVENMFTWTYPQAKTYREELIELIHTNSAPGSEARIKYESTLAGLANYAKNYGSMIHSYNKGSFLTRKQALESKITKWVQSDPKRKENYGEPLASLNKLLKEDNKQQVRDLILSYMRYSKMLSSAEQLHRLAIEKNKPNIERENGYQERDVARIEQNMKSVDRRYDETIDQSILLAMLTHYAALPKSERISSIDSFFGLTDYLAEDTKDNAAAKNKAAKLAKKLTAKLKKMYQKTELNSQSQRLALMDKPVEYFNNSQDPFIKLAVASFTERQAIEDKAKQLSGDIQAYRPKYMEALIAYFNANKLPVYADANSTLRITYGNVKGYSPQDGLLAVPFTTLEGITAKNTGVTPFDAPQKQLDLIDKKHYGEYLEKSLGSVPVNYLGNLDITGGNSGSPTLNSNAEMVGLVFDGVYESIIGDWDYDTKLNRSIHVDVRYILWAMQYVDGADNLIAEMDIVE